MKHTRSNHTRRALARLFCRVCSRVIAPKHTASILYRSVFGRSINWKNPKDINEKINWLMFNTNTERWSELADKYRVREYVKKCGYEDMLVPLYGKWDKATDINWNDLPNQFVIKVNNGCGNVLICRDKASLNTRKIERKYDKLMRKGFGIVSAEPHYLKIKPCIIAEQLLDKETSLIDYKIWCFNGKPECIMLCSDRRYSHTLSISMFDLDWNNHPEWIVYSKHYIKPQCLSPRPKSFDRMIEAASVLSKGFEEVRVDFYDIAGIPYFGEMTFTSAAGRMNYYTQEFLNHLGEKVVLPR